MKKSLLSLALLGAFASTAMAADNNNVQAGKNLKPDTVQLYGIVDLGFEHLTFDNKSVNRIGSGSQSTSRIGVKGEENLGGGLSAFFVAETGYCANGNDASGTQVYTAVNPPGQGAQYQAGGSYCSGGNFMGRLSVLGLKGGFGNFHMGRFYSFNYLNQVAVDPFGTGTTGAVKNIDRAGYTFVRLSQGVGYFTPNFAGFTAGVNYGFGAQPGNSSAGRMYEFNLNYKKGPILAGIDYLNQNAIAAGATTNPYANPAFELGGGAMAVNGGYYTNKVTQVYGAYDFGVVTISGLYSQQKYGEGLTYTGTKQEPNIKVWMVGASVPVGPGNIMASVSQRKDSNLANTQARQYAIGYTYNLSKQTNLYTSYARISNDSAVDQYVGDNNFTGNGTMGGQSSSGFALGIRHKF
ncbi:MAG: porin [Thiomonas delicata]